MMINDPGDFAAHIALLLVKNVVIYQSDFFDGRSIWKLLPKLIVEVKLVLRDLAVLEVLHDLQVAEEISSVAVDDRYPRLPEFQSVVIGET